MKKFGGAVTAAMQMLFAQAAAYGAYAPLPIELNASAYVDPCLDGPQTDRDGDWLRDDQEHALAAYFAPYLKFDSDESTTETGEPVVLFQVTPSRESSPGGCVGAECPAPTYLQIRYGLFWQYDGGYPFELGTFWCSTDSHAGDNQAFTVTLQSSDGGRIWQYLETSGDATDNPHPQEQHGISHPVLYLSDGKHHYYWKASADIEFPGGEGDCDDSVDGNHPTLNGLPNLQSVFADGRYNNVGEPSRLGKDFFVDCLPSFPPTLWQGPPHCGGHMSAWGQMFYAMEHESQPFWLRNHVTAFRPGTSPLPGFSEILPPSGLPRFTATGSMAVQTSACREFNVGDYMDVNATVEWERRAIRGAFASGRMPGAAIDPGHSPTVPLQNAPTTTVDAGQLATATEIGVCPGARSFCVSVGGPSSPVDSEYWCQRTTVDVVRPSVLQPDAHEQGSGNDLFQTAVYLGTGSASTSPLETGNTVWIAGNLTHHKPNHTDVDFFRISLPEGNHVLPGPSGPQQWEECVPARQFVTSDGLVAVTRLPGVVSVTVRRNEPLQCNNERPVKITIYDESKNIVNDTYSSHWARSCPNSVFSDVDLNGHKDVTFAISDPVSRGPYEVSVTYAPSGWIGDIVRPLTRPPNFRDPPWHGQRWERELVLPERWGDDGLRLRFPADAIGGELGEFFEVDIAHLSGRALWMDFVSDSKMSMEFILFSEEGRFVRRAAPPLDHQEPSAVRIDLRGLPDGRYFLAVSAAVAREAPYKIRFLAPQESIDR